MGCARGARKRTGLRRNVCGDGFALLPGMRAQVRRAYELHDDIDRRRGNDDLVDGRDGLVRLLLQRVER